MGIGLELTLKMRNMSKIITQKHHLSYDPDIHGQLFKGEHWVLTQLNRRKKISKWFVQCLEIWIVLNKPNAKEIK